jgi:hypothetical protein
MVQSIGGVSSFALLKNVSLKHLTSNGEGLAIQRLDENVQCRQCISNRNE